MSDVNTTSNLSRQASPIHPCNPAPAPPFSGGAAPAHNNGAAVFAHHAPPNPNNESVSGYHYSSSHPPQPGVYPPTEPPSVQRRTPPPLPKAAETNMESIITIPGDKDVLYGAPFDTSMHPGNVNYRKLMKAVFHEYQRRNRPERKKVVELILDETNNVGGRFLIFDPHRNGYLVMSNDMAKEKIESVMEECLRRSRNSHKNNYNGDHRNSSTTTMEGQHQDRASFPPDLRLSKARTPPKNLDDFHHGPPRTKKVRTEPVSEMVQEPGGIQFHSNSDSNDIRTDPNQNNSTSNNESTKSHTEDISSWSQQLKEVELKFGVTTDENMNYPNRIREIERVAGEKAEQKEKFKLPSILQQEEIEAMTKLIEKAEERWGVEAPEHFNLAQRIELVEKTAFNFMARLQVWL